MGGDGFASRTKHNRLPFRGGSTPKAKPDDHRSCRAGFQSPSFRGGGTPASARNSLALCVSTGFNPLRFGAGALPEEQWSVVVSGLSVSIPFVSGREHSLNSVTLGPSGTT